MKDIATQEDIQVLAIRFYDKAKLIKPQLSFLTV